MTKAVNYRKKILLNMVSKHVQESITPYFSRIYCFNNGNSFVLRNRRDSNVEKNNP